MKAADKNRNGEIDLQEFEKAMGDFLNTKTIKRMKCIKKIIDDDEDDAAKDAPKPKKQP